MGNGKRRSKSRRGLMILVPLEQDMTLRFVQKSNTNAGSMLISVGHENKQLCSSMLLTAKKLEVVKYVKHINKVQWVLYNNQRIRQRILPPSSLISTFVISELGRLMHNLYNVQYEQCQNICRNPQHQQYPYERLRPVQLFGTKVFLKALRQSQSS